MNRRLALTLCGTFALEATIYASLAPLLGHLVDRFDISLPQAGLLVAGYPLGMIAGALAAGRAGHRFGAQRVILAGNSLFVAASLLFGFAPTLALVGIARILQGFACGAVWTSGLAWLFALAPREERGRWIGIALGAATIGTVAGPVVGVLAIAVGVRSAFAGVAVIALCLTLATAAIEPPEVIAPQAPVAPLFRRREIRGGAGLVAFQSSLFAMVATLIPVRLAALDSTGGSAPTFLVAALLAIAVNPLAGTIADRRGAATVARFGLATAPLLLLGLGAAATAWVLIVLSVAYLGIAWNVIEVAAVASFSAVAERHGGIVVGCVALMVTIGVGELVGAVGAGALGSALGYAPAFALAAVSLVLVGLPMWGPQPV